MKTILSSKAPVLRSKLADLVTVLGKNKRCFGTKVKKRNAPPLMLYQTASPHVYISSCAIDEAPDPLPPQTYFTQTKLPPCFTNFSATYVPPKEISSDPRNLIPEVAFLGRSNVGKSSLLNALTYQKELARTSKTPGRTQMVNYFAVNDLVNLKKNSLASPHGYLVDLPGYGYAKGPDKAISSWQDSTQTFIESRMEVGTLQRLFILIDSRRAISQMDSTVLQWLDEAGLDYTVVLTKGDCVARPLKVKLANEIGMRFHSQLLGDQGESWQSPFIHVTSSKEGAGILELMWAIQEEFDTN